MLDSIQRPYSFQGSPNELFKQFIQIHNSQVEPSKQFIIRNVNVPDSNNYINRENSNYSNTWSAISQKLIDTNAGYLETGASNDGKRYIDYISEYTHRNSQLIQFGENLLDITQYLKGENIKTAIIPLGNKNEQNDNILTIKSVNDGKDYIYDETAVNLFGWIWDTVEYNDVTLPENLLKKGKQYLNSVINESITIELSAVDLHNLDCDIEKFKKGDLVRVISIPHKLDRYFLVSKLSLNLDDPKASKLTLGQTFTTLTQRQLDKDKEIKNTVYNINYTVNKEVKNDVDNLKKEVTSINNTVVEIPTEYVKTETFNDFKTDVNKKFSETLDLSAYIKITDADNKYATLINLNELVARVEKLENKNEENEGGTN